MKKLFIFIFLILNGCSFAQTQEEQLSIIIAKQEADWNKNDMNAFASSFTEDGILINFIGLFWKGRTEIINQFKQINECCIRPTHIKLDIVDTKFLSDNSAVAHIRETLTAKEDYNVPGKVVTKGSVDHKFITAVFVKQNDYWKIISMQVTQVVPLPPR